MTTQARSTEEQIEEKLQGILAEVHNGNARRFIESFLWVRDKAQKLVPFVFNEVQDWYWQRRTFRDIILKFRQGGFSTLILAEFFAKAITKPGTNAAIISYEKVATQMLLEKVELFYKYLLEKFPQINWPIMTADSRNMKGFESLDSKLYIGTAQQNVFGAGSTITDLHGSEMAKWDQADIKNFMAGFEEAVPKLPNTRLIYECTAQGEGDEFHQKYLAAKMGNSIFTAHFAPWFIFKANSLPEGSPFALPNDRGRIEPTAGELDLMLKYNLNIEQLRFWRMIKAERKELAEQEYPFDDVTCFITSGGNVWDRDKLKLWLDRCRPATIEEDGLRIWQGKRQGERCIICADVASGTGADFDYALVLNDKPAHLASLRGKWRPVEFAHRLDALGKRYDNCLISVERNTGWGDAVLDELINVIHYPYLYKHQDYQDLTKPLRMGWYTDVKTKPQMISAVTDVVDENRFQTDDELLVRELLSHKKFVNSRGNIEYRSSGGGNDDGVSALGQGLKVLEFTLGQGKARKKEEAYGFKW